MKTINNYFGAAIFFAVIFFANNTSAQDASVQMPKEPNINTNVKSTSNAAINNFVTQSFAMFSNTRDFSQKIQIIQTNIVNGNADGGLTQNFADLNDAMNGFQNIKSNGPALLTSVTNIIANIKDQHLGILEIPRALLNLREALKAIKYSVESSVSMLKIIPDLKRKIAVNGAAEADTKNSPLQQEPSTKAGEETTTVITFSGISFSQLQALEDSLKTCPIMISLSKKLSGGIATIEIMHTGSLSELWKFMAVHCKDTANENKITAWDETNNRIDIAMK